MTLPRLISAGHVLAADGRDSGHRNTLLAGIYTLTTRMLTITGVVRDEHGRAVLLRHRLWPPDRQWGFPTGYASKGERHEDTIAREVREETGLTVKAGRLLKVRSGFRYRIEVYYEAVLVGGLDGLTLDPKEVLEASLFSPADLPDGIPETHRELAGSL